MDKSQILFSLKEIISRYDLDQNGILDPKETFCCLLGILGPGYSANYNHVVYKLYNNPKYEAIEVEEIKETTYSTYRGKIPLKGIEKFCEDVMNESEEMKSRIYNNVLLHGYELDENKENLRLNVSDPIPETYQTVCMRVAKKLIEHPSHPYLLSWMLDLSNSMFDFRDRPNREVMDLMIESKFNVEVESYWDNLEAQWKLDEKVSQTDCFDKNGIWNKKFTRASEEIFARYDGNNDGKLEKHELQLFQSVLYGRLIQMNHVEDWLRLNSPTLKTIMQEAISDNYHQDLLIKFVFWHGYNTDLELKPKVNSDPITIDTLIARLCEEIESKACKAVKFEQEILSDLILFLLYDDSGDFDKPNNERTQACAKALGLFDLLDIFQLKRSEVVKLNTAGEAINLITLTFRYTRKYESEQKLFMRNAENLVYNYVKDNKNEFSEKLFASDTLERTSMTEPVEDYLNNKLCRTSGGKPSNIIELILSSLKIEEESPRYFDNVWNLIDPLVLLNLVLRLIRITPYNSDIGLAVIIDLLEPFNEIESKNILNTMIEKQIAPKEFVDYISCNLYKIPYPDILPEEEKLCQMTADQIERVLADYCGIKEDKINEYCYKNKLITFQQSIGEVILTDANSLFSLGLDRKLIVTKLMAVLDIGDFVKLNDQLEQSRKEEYRDRDWELEAQRRIEEISNIIQETLGDKANDTFRVVKCYTGGHHQDMFHPSVAFTSYYLKYDRIGGSADCLIINRKMLSEKHRDLVDKWTNQDLEELLSNRLNAPKSADWESWDGFLYCSDMNPYLIRVACCFEGAGTRYRVDPMKLCRILELIH